MVENHGLSWIGRIIGTAIITLPALLALSAPPSAYIGVEACKECHADEYKRFTTCSKMSRSYEAVAMRKKRLTEAEFGKCLGCHTSGYGKPGGFRSEEETPLTKNVGCEACHGPGAAHAKSGEAKDIQRKPGAKMCQSCHGAERAAIFGYKGLLYGGAH